MTCFTLTFMGHSMADDLMQNLTETLVCFPTSKTVQLSIDDPRCQMESFPQVVAAREKLSPDSVFGPRGLHRVHAAEKAGMHATPVDTYLPSLISLFHENFAQETGSPLPFTSCCWERSSTGYSPGYTWSTTLKQSVAAYLCWSWRWTADANVVRWNPGCHGFKR